MVMGNQAIALGALKAGVNMVAGYPGTPSSEIIEFIAKYREKTGTYVEWSVNEKAAVEVCAGASYAGSRTLVTMKQVGLNVASDPVMCLSYVGVKGGMVIVSADDPGPISSQTEQDTRKFAEFSKIPCLDPSTPLEAYEMVQKAFEISEKYGTPVLLRPTTRVDHAYESMEIPELTECRKPGEFQKDTQRWVIFPRTSYMNHKRIFERNEKILPEEFYKSDLNKIVFVSDIIEEKLKVPSNSSLYSKSISHLFVAGGISYCYLMEALLNLKEEFPENEEIDNCAVLKIGSPYPFPYHIAKDFLLMDEDAEVTVFEELDPVIEEKLIYFCGKENFKRKIHGKLDGSVPEAGELSVEIVKKILKNILDCAENNTNIDSSAVVELAVPESGRRAETTGGCNSSEPPELPVRPPVLCAGCPHRASFYAVKQATKGEKTVFCGDIGCYTLGNAKPLDMCDTCLCMGADITMAQGFFHNEPDRKCFSFIGDSTFFASGITGVVNAVYNQAHITLCILDNSTTAMTGHQPHPGTGRTMMGEIVEKISIPAILKAVGVNPVIEIDPFDQEKAVAAVKEASNSKGVSAVIFKAPCIAIAGKLGYTFPKAKNISEEKCIGCQKCIKELGCPALSISVVSNSKGKKIVEIDKSLCTGCGLCAGVCPVKAIE